jgi:hypothetical protein
MVALETEIVKAAVRLASCRGIYSAHQVMLGKVRCHCFRQNAVPEIGELHGGPLEMGQLTAVGCVDDPVLERLFGLGFALDQLRRDAEDLTERVGELAPAASGAQ